MRAYVRAPRASCVMFSLVFLGGLRKPALIEKAFVRAGRPQVGGVEAQKRLVVSVQLYLEKDTPTLVAVDDIMPAHELSTQNSPNVMIHIYIYICIYKRLT